MTVNPVINTTVITIVPKWVCVVFQSLVSLGGCCAAALTRPQLMQGPYSEEPLRTKSLSSAKLLRPGSGLQKATLQWQPRLRVCYLCRFFYFAFDVCPLSQTKHNSRTQFIRSCFVKDGK